MSPTLRGLVARVVELLSQLGIGSILRVWRTLIGILTPKTSSYATNKISTPRGFDVSLGDDGDVPSIVVYSASKVPSSLSGCTTHDTLIDVEQTIPSHHEQVVEGPALSKTTPSMSLRYRRTRIVSAHQLSFNPRTALLPACHDASNPEIPSLVDWNQYIHPEGQRYYYHAENHVVTEANLQAPKNLERINFWMSQFDILRENSGLELPNTYELLLELDLQEEGCSYYLIDHDLQTTFYLDDTDTGCLDLPDVCSTDHLKILLEEQYWIHLEYFPMHKSLPPSSQSNLIGILTHAWGDQSTSSLSTAPYSAEKCKEFINMIEKFTGGPEQEGYKTCLVSRLMNEMIHSRFINLYGQADGARLARNQSTEPGRDQPICRPIRAAFMLLLCQPYRELEELRSLWVDNIVYTEHWRTFVESRMQEWQSVSLMSAILLLVDTTLIVHFPQQPMHSGWTAQVSWQGTVHLSGIVSLLLSMTAVIVGVTSVLVHQPLRNGHAIDANAYLQNASHEMLGLQPLAIVLSLPRTLFMWALATAGLALLMVSFQLLDVWSMGVIGIFALLLNALLIWAIRFFHIRESRPGMFSIPFTFPPRLKFRHKNAEQSDISETA